VGALSTRVPFANCRHSLTFPVEQFWGRAARASWIRKNPDACFSLWENRSSAESRGARKS
jgi:hypothetical protein